MKTNKGTGKDGETKTPRITFSVSKEFESILPEIDSMPNMSRFVCEAIQEKLQRVKNPNKDLQEALSHFMQIQQVLGGQQTSNANPSGVPVETFQNPYGAQATPPPIQRAEQTVEKAPEKVEVTESLNEVEDAEPEMVQVKAPAPLPVNKQDEQKAEPVSEETKHEPVIPEVKVKEEEEVLNELQKNFFKPRTSR